MRRCDLRAQAGLSDCSSLPDPARDHTVRRGPRDRGSECTSTGPDNCVQVGVWG